MRSTVHKTLHYKTSHMVFGRKMILNISHEATCKFIKERKQKKLNTVTSEKTAQELNTNTN